MNCEDFESKVADLAREQMMEASVFAQALAHHKKCEACARQLDDQRSLSFGLSALARETNTAELPPMGTELLHALRGQRAATDRPVRVASRRSRAMVAGAMAVAAMVLVVIAVGVIRSRSASPTVQAPPNSTSTKNLPPSELANVETTDHPAPHFSPLPNKSSGWGSRRVARRNSSRNVNQTIVPVQAIADVSSKDITKQTATSITADSAAEITTDFMPVGYAGATTLQDGGQLVRVELPRSALVAFGLPMNVNRYDKKVKADVFFSADGMARAIRFVQ